MSLGNKEVLSRNLRRLMNERKIDRQQICKDLGFKYTTLTDWYNGNKYPRIDSIEKMANYFSVRKSDLIEEQSGVFGSVDVLSTEAKEIAKAFDKATPKEKSMVRLTLSEYLDDQEYQYAAARGSSRVKIPLLCGNQDDYPETDTNVDDL